MCLGNTCRSPAAEGFIRKFARDTFSTREFRNLMIDSAGLNSYFSRAQEQSIRFVKELESENISTHKSKKITNELAREADVILIMESYMRERIKHLFPSITGLEEKIIELKVFSPNVDQHDDLDIEDPYMMSDSSYRNIIVEIRDYCKFFVDEWFQMRK
jgi:protein-tyrosine phosphatase